MEIEVTTPMMTLKGTRSPSWSFSCCFSRTLLVESSFASGNIPIFSVPGLPVGVLPPARDINFCDTVSLSWVFKCLPAMVWLSWERVAGFPSVGLVLALSKASLQRWFCSVFSHCQFLSIPIFLHPWRLLPSLTLSQQKKHSWQMWLWSRKYPLGHIVPQMRFWSGVQCWITFFKPHSWHGLQLPIPWLSEYVIFARHSLHSILVSFVTLLPHCGDDPRPSGHSGHFMHSISAPGSLGS